LPHPAVVSSVSSVSSTWTVSARLSVELDAEEAARLLAELELACFATSAETPRDIIDVSAETQLRRFR
jgi:hypothetical protein